jgi:ribosomal protein S19
MENFINLKRKLKIHFRDQIIPNVLKNSKVLIYNGQRYISVFVSKEKIGYKFGEFSFTRKKCIHKKKKVLKKKK